MARYALPHDTRAVFGEWASQCRNPGLLFERYVPVIEEDGQKQRALQQIARCPQDGELITAHWRRWQAMAAALGAHPPGPEPFMARTEWRFITGLGRKGALEVGFHFHPLYGFPVIPSSGLKGLARSWALLEAGKHEEDPEFVAVFGRARKKGEPESAGRVGDAVFLDAIPERPFELDLDVINPHYPDYYRPGSRKVPANWQSPIPVFLLAVPAGTSFFFAVGWQGKPNLAAHRLAVDWLKAGLRDLGAGAKTSSGYGYWVVG